MLHFIHTWSIWSGIKHFDGGDSSYQDRRCQCCGKIQVRPL